MKQPLGKSNERWGSVGNLSDLRRRLGHIPHRYFDAILDGPPERAGACKVYDREHYTQEQLQAMIPR